MADSDPDILTQKIQNEADLSVGWVRDNKMVCSGSKTKLMIVGTKELRQSKLANRNVQIKIMVDGCRVFESKSEKLLGVVMNNIMTWTNHLYGDEENKGLIDKLSHRASLIYKLSKMMPTARLKIIADGIFFSVLNYGIELFGNVWGISTLDEHNRNSIAYTKEDNNKLQIVMNKVLRSLTGGDRETPIEELHKRSKQLSVHQRCALFSLLSAHKALLNGQPEYHCSKLNMKRTLGPNTRQKELTRIPC